MISVIIPVHNRFDDLIVAVRSVFSQTITDYEVIVIDDHSQVELLPVISEEFNDSVGSTIFVYRNQVNCGAAQSRNIGVAYAKGEYIAFLDSDDYWMPDKLEKQIDCFCRNDKLALVYTNQLNKNRGDLQISNKKMISSHLMRHLVEGWTAPNTSTLMIKKDIFLSLGGFDEDLKSCQDHDLWFNFAKHDYSFICLDEYLSVFNCDSSERISTNYDRRMHGVEMFLNKWKNEISANTPFYGYCFFKQEYYYKTSFSIFTNFIKTKNFKQAVSIFKKYLVFNMFFYIALFSKIKTLAQLRAHSVK